MTNVIVTIEGGVVQSIIADEQVNVVVLDYDTEGCTCEDDGCQLDAEGHEVFVINEHITICKNCVYKIRKYFGMIDGS